MGPHFFKCGNNQELEGADFRRMTSMGPHFFKCGNKAILCLDADDAGTSMGPHFFKCGNLGNQPLGNQPLSDFNGAALFQVRKYDNAPQPRDHI